MADDVAVTDTTDVTDASSGSGNSTWKVSLENLLTDTIDSVDAVVTGYPGSPGSRTGPYPNGYFERGGAGSPGARANAGSTASSNSLLEVLAVGFVIYKLL